MGLPKGIQKLTSIGGTVTITDPDGPIVDLSVAGGGGALAYDGASLTGNVVISGVGPVLLQTTASLAVGTWLVSGSYLVTDGSPVAGHGLDLELVVGSATATFLGCQTCSLVDYQATTVTQATVNVTCLVVITVEGTLQFQTVQTAAWDGQAEWNGNISDGPSCGYSAVKVA